MRVTLASAPNKTRPRQAGLASLTKSNCWHGCQSAAAHCSTGARPAKFRVCGWAGLASCFTGRASRPRCCVTSAVDSHKTIAGRLCSRTLPFLPADDLDAQRPNQTRIQAFNLSGYICTSLHRFRGEFSLHKVCTATFLAHGLHTVFFPRLPENAQLLLAIIEQYCYLVGNGNTKRSNRGKW
jgi:hypothetical protein